MARPYILRRRAESQAETRSKIVEAAIELHGTIGPANTTISMIADRAGVQRHTFYSHFPDDRSMAMACSGHSFERDPPPDPEPWRELSETTERLRAGLRAVYAWYERNGSLFACVLRDAEYHALTREISDLRFGPPMARIHEVLAAKLNAKQRAMLALALSFHTWRTLTRDAGMKQTAAANTMAQSVIDAR